METVRYSISNTAIVEVLVFWNILIFTLAEGKLLKVPQNTTVVEGGRIELECTTDLDVTVYWYHNRREIFYGGEVSLQYKSLYNVTKENPGEYNLVVESATQYHNGIYTCGDKEGEGEKSSARVIVTTVTDHVTVLYATTRHTAQLNTASLTTKAFEQMGHLSTGIVVGIAVGVVLLVVVIGAILVVGLFFLRQRKRRRLEAKMSDAGENAPCYTQ